MDEDELRVGFPQFRVIQNRVEQEGARRAVVEPPARARPDVDVDGQV